MLIIAMVLISLLLLAGCIPVVPDDPDPDPILVMSIDVDVVNWDEECIKYTVENDGDLDVHYYELAFNVEFEPGNHTPMTLYTDSLGLFEVGAEKTTCIDIVCPYAPCLDPCPPNEYCCPYCGEYDVNSVEVEVLDLW